MTLNTLQCVEQPIAKESCLVIGAELTGPGCIIIIVVVVVIVT